MMDENSALIESVLGEQDQAEAAVRNHDSHGWQTVSYHKRKRKTSKTVADNKNNSADLRSGAVNEGVNVFRFVEQHSEDRYRRVMEAQSAAAVVCGEATASRSKGHSDVDDDETDAEVSGANGENGSVEVKKVKQKKPKKAKVKVAEAASKINGDELDAFLADITASYEAQQDILLMRFADYFGRAFASVAASHFPWMKLFRESTVRKLVDIPLSHISGDIYKISTDWISQRSSEALGSFVLWSLDRILEGLASPQGAVKGSKKSFQQTSSKCHVALFMVLAMVLRQKPDVMINLLSALKDSEKYQGQYKLPVTVWMIAQASQGDLATGLYLWVSLLLPMLSGKSSGNPQSRDLILQLVERILSFPKARVILLNGAVRKGERVVPPSALDSLLRITFSLPSARIQATERLEAVYPTLKEVALAGPSGSKATKQLAQQIFGFAIKAAGEANTNLSKEASDIFIWCLTQNPECYKQWDIFYTDNLEASIAVLRKLSDEWKEHSARHPTLKPLKETLKSFRQKNEKALAEANDGSRHSLLWDADTYCKAILRRLSLGHGCMKGMAYASVILVVGAVLSHSWDYKKFFEMLNF